MTDIPKSIKDVRISQYALDFCRKKYPEDNELGCNSNLLFFALLFNNINWDAKKPSEQRTK